MSVSCDFYKSTVTKYRLNSLIYFSCECHGFQGAICENGIKYLYDVHKSQNHVYAI